MAYRRGCGKFASVLCCCCCMVCVLCYVVLHVVVLVCVDSQYLPNTPNSCS